MYFFYHDANCPFNVKDSKLGKVTNIIGGIPYTERSAVCAACCTLAHWL